MYGDKMKSVVSLAVGLLIPVFLFLLLALRTKLRSLICPLSQRGLTLLGLTVLACFALASLAFGQVPYVSGTTSTPGANPAHDYFGSLTEVVDPATGSLNMHIMTPPTKERGPQSSRPAFMYQTSNVYPVPHALVDSQGNLAIFGIELDYRDLGSSVQGVARGWPNTLTFHPQIRTEQPLPGASYGVTCHYVNGYIYTDPNGGRHDLGLQYYSAGNPPNPGSNTDCSGITFSNAGGDAQYKALVDINGNVTVTDLHGNKLFPVVEDVNGNGADGTGRDYSVHVDTSGTADDNQGVDFVASPSTASGYSYSGSLNTTANYTINYTSTNGCPNYTPTFSLSRTLHNVLSIPGGLQYSFDYDPVYGLIKKITYPTGATVTYEWSIIPQSASITFRAGQYINGTYNGGNCSYRYDTVAVTKRTVAFDGVTPALEQDFSYSTDWTNPPSGSTWSAKTTTVTTKDLVRGDTTGYKTVYSYLPMRPQLPMDTSVWTDIEALQQEDTIAYYGSSGQLLQTIEKTWAAPNLIASECTALPSGLTKGTFYSYAPYSGYNSSYYAIGFQSKLTNLITDLAEFDFGLVDSTCQRPQSTPTRETVTAYHSFAWTPLFSAPSILDRPDSVKIYDHGQLVAETDYTYDENAIASVTPGALDHDTNYGAGSSSPQG